MNQKKDRWAGICATREKKEQILRKKEKERHFRTKKGKDKDEKIEDDKNKEMKNVATSVRKKRICIKIKKDRKKK